MAKQKLVGGGGIKIKNFNIEHAHNEQTTLDRDGFQMSLFFFFQQPKNDCYLSDVCVSLFFPSL